MRSREKGGVQARANTKAKVASKTHPCHGCRHYCLEKSTAKRVRRVHAHQLDAKANHVELEEGEVEERDVAVEALEEEALQYDRVLVLDRSTWVLVVYGKDEGKGTR